MVERTADGAALPGAGLLTLTAGVGRSAAVLRERLRPLTAELRREFAENAAIGVDDGDALFASRVGRRDGDGVGEGRRSVGKGLVDDDGQVVACVAHLGEQLVGFARQPLAQRGDQVVVSQLIVVLVSR